MSSVKKKNMKRYITVCLISILLSCEQIPIDNNDEIQIMNIIEGNIYIKLIDFHHLYGIICETPPEKLKEIKQQAATTTSLDNLSNSEAKMYAYVSFLINNDLLDKPHFKIKDENGTILNMYASEKEYIQLKNELQLLNREEEQIAIKCIANKLSDVYFNEPLYYVDRFICIQKSNGQTDWDK